MLYFNSSFSEENSEKNNKPKNKFSVNSIMYVEKIIMSYFDTYELAFAADSTQTLLSVHYISPSARVLHSLTTNELGRSIEEIFPRHQALMYYDTFQRMKKTAMPCHFLRELADGSLWEVEVTYTNRILRFVGTRQDISQVSAGTEHSEVDSYGTHQGGIILTRTEWGYVVENIDAALEPILCLRTGDSWNDYFQHSQQMSSPFLLDLCLQRNGLSYLLDSYREEDRFTYLLFFLYPLHNTKQQLIMNVHTLTAERYYEIAAGYSQISHSHFHAPCHKATTPTRCCTSVHLTTREKEVLHLLMDGLSYKAIAAHLVIASGTVKKLASNIYHKYDVASRSELVHLLYQDSDRLLASV